MEQHARVQLGKNQTERVDWGKVNAVDWGKIMELLMTLLPIILKIFGL
jgi:hypothetical protein